MNNQSYARKGTGREATMSELEIAQERIAELEQHLNIGTEEGSICNRRCNGVMAISTSENCSCHINAPCGLCEENRPVCTMCLEEAGR